MTKASNKEFNRAKDTVQGAHMRASETPHDEGPITLTLKVMRNGSDRLQLAVRDSGSGLPEEFSLQDASGSGMTIVTSAVENLRGGIRIMPDNAVGFEIDLPQDGGTKRIPSHPEKAS